MKKIRKLSRNGLLKKCDRLLQELGRATYKQCLVCGGEYSCLHHYIPKSRSNHLRYNFKNCIPLCNRCHCYHHTGVPFVQNAINSKMKKSWLEELNQEYQKGIGKPLPISKIQETYELLLKLYDKREHS